MWVGEELKGRRLTVLLAHKSIGVRDEENLIRPAVEHAPGGRSTRRGCRLVLGLVEVDEALGRVALGRRAKRRGETATNVRRGGGDSSITGASVEPAEVPYSPRARADRVRSA